ncbi:MAG: APC family permease, partial [Shinella sp.]
HRTIPIATYASVLLIGVFYMFTSWLMVNAAGYEKLLPELQGLADPTTFLFVISERYVGAWLSPIMNILLITSLFAGVLAFHNGVARYMYVAGRERLLPAGLGVTHPAFQSPHVASLVQTAIAVAVIALFAVTGQDPVLALFSWMTNVGTLGVIVLMAMTAFAIVVFFSRNPGLEKNALTTKVVPAVTGLILLAVIVTIVRNFGDLAGASGALAVILPGLVLLAALLGLVLAMRLKGADPASYARLGLGQAN